MEELENSVVGSVRRALEKTGYPLEMRVAKIARAHSPLYVEQSRYYIDPQTEKVRETDVLTGWSAMQLDPDTRDATWAFVYLAIECKSKPAPWVLFEDDSLAVEDADMLLDLAVINSESTPLLLQEALGRATSVEDTLLSPARIATGVTDPTADKNREGGNPAWAAVQSAVSAAHGFKRDLVVAGDEGPHAVILPVVVTSGSLCRAFLDHDGDLQVEQIQWGQVTVRRFDDDRRTRCLIVAEPYVDELMRRGLQTAKLFGFAFDVEVPPPFDPGA